MSEPIDITPKKDGGVLKEIIEEGSGEVPPPGSKTIVHYTGTFVDGKKFDSSWDWEVPFVFNLGKGTVIKGWEIGVASMKQGERAILTCAPEYAYGKTGNFPTIPPDTPLKFEIELLEWQGEDLSPNFDEGIQRIQIRPGHGQLSPIDGAAVQVHLIGKYEGNVFEERDVAFTVGEGSEYNIVKGIELALERFKKKETSRLIIKPKYAFGSTGNSDYNIPPNATVEYVITLKTFEKVAELWCLDPEEKVEEAKLFKQKGNDYYKVSKYELAVKFYQKILEYLEKELDDSIGRDRDALVLAAYLNLSICYIKMKDYVPASKAAAKAIQMNRFNEKAHFRHGVARLHIGDMDTALQDFDFCLKVNKANKAAHDMRQVCLKLEEAGQRKDREKFKDMFDKFAKMDIQREEFEKTKQPNVMSSVGQWGQEDREREPSEFEKENPDILLLNGTGEFKDM